MWSSNSLKLCLTIAKLKLSYVWNGTLQNDLSPKETYIKLNSKSKRTSLGAKR